MLKFAYFTNSKWQATALLKMVNLQYILNRSTETKFCRNMQIAFVNRSDSENLHISKIPYGGRPPYCKSKIRNITSTVQPIKMSSRDIDIRTHFGDSQN